MLEINENPKIANTLTTVEKDNIIRQDKLIFLGAVGDKKWLDNGKNLSRNFPEGNRVYSDKGIAKTITAQGAGIGGNSGLYMVETRIRRFTPRECVRLMDFPDTFIWECSDSQMYKQAGNSIVRAVLAAVVDKIPFIKNYKNEKEA